MDTFLQGSNKDPLTVLKGESFRLIYFDSIGMQASEEEDDDEDNDYETSKAFRQRTRTRPASADPHPPNEFSGQDGNPRVTCNVFSPPLPSFRHPLKDANFESHPGVQERGFQVRNDRYSRSIRSVIELDEQFPEFQEMKELVLEEFEESLFTSKRYDEVTREHLAKRGDFGTVRLEPIEEAKPKSCTAVRVIGLREERFCWNA